MPVNDTVPNINVGELVAYNAALELDQEIRNEYIKELEKSLAKAEHEKANAICHQLSSDAVLGEARSLAHRLRRQRDHWKGVAEEKAWPFEWQVATRLKEERNEAKKQLVKANKHIEFLEERHKKGCETIDSLMSDRDEARAERDKAIAKIRRLKATANILVTEGNQARERVKKVEAERDAARRLTDKWKEIVDRVAIWGDRLKNDREEARRWACKMRRQRDEAVETLRKDREDRWQALEAMKRTVAFTKRMIAERDEAQKHAEEMGNLVGRALTILRDIHQDIMERRRNA